MNGDDFRKACEQVQDEAKRRLKTQYPISGFLGMTFTRNGTSVTFVRQGIMPEELVDALTWGEVRQLLSMPIV